MKTLKSIIMLAGALLAFNACKDVTVGYLWTEDAQYKPAVLEVRTTLDPVLDADRIKWGFPWLSTPIEGVQGTRQIFVTITEIKTTEGNADKMGEYLKVYGDGTFEVPVEHDIPPGDYVISLNFRNEGRSKNVNDCFTVRILP